MFLSFIVAVSLNIHGYSISLLGSYIGQSGNEGVLFGTPKSIRSDDWAVSLPAAISQWNHKPKLPLVNQNMSNGQNMMASANIPVLNWAFIFKPQTWGYIFGVATGLSWAWTFQLFFTMAVSYLLFLKLSGGSVVTGLASSVMLVYSPFFQFWSLNCSSAVGFALLSCLFLDRLFSKSDINWVQKGLLAAGIGWAGLGLVLVYYPPYSISLGLFVFFYFLGLALQVANIEKVSHLLKKIRWLFIPLIILAIGLVLLFADLANIIPIMLKTEYPGQRVNAGGALETINILFSHLLNYQQVDYNVALGNICEAAGFFVFLPFSLFLLILHRSHLRKADFYFPSLIFAVVCIFLAWMFIQMPKWYGSITLLNRVPETRLKLAFGVADLVLFLTCLGLIGKNRFELRSKLNWFFVLLFSALWFSFLALVFHDVNRIGVTLARADLLKILCAELIFILVLIFRPHAAIFVRLFSILPIVYGFNPIVRDGTKELLNNPLASEILRWDETFDGKSRWIVYGSWPLGNYVRSLGVNVLTGTQFTPDLPFWKNFDPSGEKASVYNRFSSVNVELAERVPTDFKLIQGDAFTVKINPAAPALEKLHYNFLLLQGECGIICEKAGFVKSSTHESFVIYVRSNVLNQHK